MVKVSVIVPVHNEGEVLEGNVRKIETLLEGQLKDYEIIIAEDGSTDGSATIARSLESGRIRSLNSQKRMGKGAAIRRAANFARGQSIIFMDVDLASDPKQVAELVRLLDEGADMVIGSRYKRLSRCRRSAVRYVFSRSFNLLVQGILGSRLSDHQCGFKAFRKGKVLPVINKVEDKGWFWDTELLVRAQREGLKVSEMPVEWKESDSSKFRLLRDSFRMAKSLIRFRLKG